MATVLLAAALVAGCRGQEEPPPVSPPLGPAARHPVIVIGIDGAEWRVVRRLWAEGKLPHLKALAERGTSATLATAYTASPVIWTTIATGVEPSVHGITDFAVATPRGDVPVASTLRRVPALWTMLSRVKRKVAVLGWWATWPAERIAGVVVTDRALLDVRRRVSPPGFLPRFEREAAAAEKEENLFHGNDASRRQDHLVAHVARGLAGEGYDLLLVYFRGVDIASHNHWKHYEPDAFPSEVRPTAEEIAAYGDLVPREYEAVDAALGRILAAADPASDVFVLSDHGFEPARHEIVNVFLDFDRVLERLGYLAHDHRSGRRGGIDFARTKVYTWATPDFRRGKRLRFALAGREPGGTVRPAEMAAIRRRLAADLARLTWKDGSPAFRLRDPRRGEAAQGVGLVVQVQTDRATEELLLDGDPQPLTGAVSQVSRVSGTHGEHTDGLFVAAGPDIQPGAPLAGLSVRDITPTVLYALGLPVARDFAGRARTDLFREIFRQTHPLREIASWGAAQKGFAAASPADEKLLDELGALGYLR